MSSSPNDSSWPVFRRSRVAGFEVITEAPDTFCAELEAVIDIQAVPLRLPIVQSTLFVQVCRRLPTNHKPPKT